ncbi:Hypothetical protein D9617_2g056120 [Elsinoe fawcettii]|nr:Hypothetical protein D9617_2g056120 [Elsinoe fawcettii]
MSSTRVVSESATSADTDTGLSAPTRSPKTSTSVWGFDLGRPIASMIGITSQRMSTITSTSEASSSPSSTTLSSTTTFDVSASDLASSMTASRPVPIDSSGITWMPTSSGFLTTTSPSSAMAESSPSILPDSTNTSRSTLTSSFFRVSESKTSTDVQSTTQTTGTQKFDSTTWIISTSNALSTASGSGQITQTEVEASSDSDSVTITRSIERTRASQSSGDPDPSGTTVDIGLGPTTAIPDITPTVVPDRPSTIPTPAPPPTASNPGPPPTAVIPGPPPVISSPPSPSRVQSTTLVITSATGCELRTGSMCTQLCSFATDGAGGTTSSSCARASCLPSIGCSATIATITRTTDPACSLLPEPEGLFATDGDGPLPTLLHTAQVVIRAPGEPSTSTTTSIGFTLISTVPAPQPTASLSPSQKFIYIDNIKNCTTSGAEPRCDYFWSAMERTPGMRGGQESDRCTDRSIWYGNSSSTVPNYPIDVGPFDLPSYKSCSLRKESESDGGTILCGSTATTCNYR